MSTAMSEDKMTTAKELLYTTVFAQSFSPCGKYLAASSNFGRISIFGLVSALGPTATAETWKPIFSFKAHTGPVYSLVSNERFLISAGIKTINAWSWTEVIAKAPKVCWSLSLPSTNTDGLSSPEINMLALDDTYEGGVRLLAGSGDNLVHSWDITSGAYLRGYSGHSDYIHAIALRSSSNNPRQFLSASEDGTVRLWDMRSAGEAVHIIEPYKNANCCRPRLGKYVATVAVDNQDDWMVCGGGPSLCLYHLRSLSPTTVLSTEPNNNVPFNHACFHEDTILGGGGEGFVSHWSFNGDYKARVPSSSTNIFNIAINNKPQTSTTGASTRILSVSGNSYKIDICTNFSYKAFSLSFG